MVRPTGIAAGPGGPGMQPRITSATPAPIRPALLFGTGIRYFPTLILMRAPGSLSTFGLSPTGTRRDTDEPLRFRRLFCEIL